MKTLIKALARLEKKFPGISFEICDERGDGNHLFVYVGGGYASVDCGVHCANGPTIASVIDDLKYTHKCDCEECKRGNQTKGLENEIKI